MNFDKCIMTWIHDYNVIKSSFATPRYLSCFTHSSLPITKPVAITDTVTDSVVLFIHCEAFLDESRSLSNLLLCLFMAWQLIALLSLNSIPCVNMPQFIHSAIEGHLCHFLVFGTYEKAAITCESFYVDIRPLRREPSEIKEDCPYLSKKLCNFHLLKKI